MPAKDTGETAPNYSNPDQTTGFHDDNAGITYWDYATQSYVTTDVDGNPLDVKNDLDLGYYQNSQGDYVYGTPPDDKYLSPDGGIYISGIDPNGHGQIISDTPFTFGGGPDDQVVLDPTDGYNDDGTLIDPVIEEPVIEEPVIEEPVIEGPSTEDPDDDPTNETEFPIEDPNDDIIDPIIEEPTDDWFWTDPVDYTNAPQPDGDGSFVTGGPPPDTSWDWNFFRDKAPGDRQWGGYDEDYQAFERYQPGMDSPWGMPNIKGGNEDFYQQQFVNQLRDEQGFRSRQRDADRNRQLVAEEQATGTGYYAPTDPAENWSWAYGGQGLPDVQMGTGETGGESPQYTLNSNFTSGESTQGDILRWAASGKGFSQAERDFYSAHLNNPANTNNDSTYWASRSDPNTLINNLPTDSGTLTENNQRHMTSLFNALFNPTSASVNGPTAPVGYASPIQGFTG